MIQLVGLLDNLWSLRLPELNWEILSDGFAVKALGLFKEYGENNLLHIRLSSLLKSILAFLLKESESYSRAAGNADANLLPQMSSFSPPNREASAKTDSARRCAQMLRETLEFLSEGVVGFLKGLGPREKNKFLFKGFVIQLCRIVIPFEKRGHPVVKDSAHWKDVYYNFLFHELKKEDCVLVEDPRQRGKTLEEDMRLPSNFKFNNASLQGKMNLRSNYDSLGTKNVVLDEEDEPEADEPRKQVLQGFGRRAEDSDSDSDSSESDEELLKQFSFGRPGDLCQPKTLESSEPDSRPYDSGTGQGVDFKAEPAHKPGAFEKESAKDIYDIVNDWNIYAQGSWKGLGEELRESALQRRSAAGEKEKTQATGEGPEGSSSDPECEGLQRHKISRKDNQKYGLYGSLTRRFQIKKKSSKGPKEARGESSSFYNSGAPGGQSPVER